MDDRHGDLPFLREDDQPRQRLVGVGRRRLSLGLATTRDEVAELNALARDRLRQQLELGIEHRIDTSWGERLFASGDRIMFLRNERGLGVKNGSLGIVESLSATRMAVLMDDGRSVAFDVKDYADVDHGYAATIHKSQGVTVDRVHVLTTARRGTSLLTSSGRGTGRPSPAPSS